jgi:dipeptidyl aminopeptidase/acylaminoacyl peptidase
MTLSLVVAAMLSVAAEPAAPAYQNPSPAIVAILDAPQPPMVMLSPDHRFLVELERPSLSPLSELAEPVVRVAGLKINPRTNGPAREYAFRAMAVKPLAPGPAKEIRLPDGARIRSVRWSKDGQHLAFTLTRTEGVELWVADAATASARRLTEPVLNATYGAPCDWLPGDQGLVCKVVPELRGDPPAAAGVPMGPRIEENLGRKAPARTYTNLLESPHDEALFEHYLTSAIVQVGLDGSTTGILEPALVDGVTPSPDGRYLLVTTIHRPFSYQVPVSRFPQRHAVVDRTSGGSRVIAELPLADDVPVSFDSVRRGRREVGWRSDRPATLWWVEALDGGDAGAEAEHRDAVSTLEAPFDGEPRLLWRTGLRFGGALWGDDKLALAYEYWWSTRRLRAFMLDPSNPGSEAELLHDRSLQDAYSDPGTPLTRPGPHGAQVLRLTPDRSAVYLSGRGASPEGVYPFLDRLDLTTRETTRLWRAADPYYERLVDVLDDDARRYVTRRESPDEPPNYHLHGGEQPVQLTDYADPAPAFSSVTKQLIRYERGDGVQLSGTLYLPPGYDAQQDGPLPMFLWAYPSEFKSRDDAGQITTTDNSFVRPAPWSILYLLLEGYAILDDPSLPIIGEGDVEPNDTYVEQLVAGARAAIDAVVELGVGNRDRMAIGGHSYGAFTAANLLAHSDLFRAGIGRSGAYNRTLTPFGFQAEERTLWQALDTYIAMSPFAHADQIDEPLLLIHGADDSNSGTYPVQSERLYEAMRGLGGTVRWVELPHEDHGYRSRESVGHVLWEMTRWLDAYVGNAGPREPQPESGE